MNQQIVILQIQLSESTKYNPQEIGGDKGQYGKVFRGVFQQNLNGQTVSRGACIKEIKKDFVDERKLKMLINETELCTNLQKAENPNLVQVYEIVEKGNEVYIVMEECDSDLETYFEEKKGRLSNEKIQTIALDILNGYRSLHRQNIIHRDLKFENLLVKNEIIKIADFGLSRVLEPGENMNQTRLGSPLTAAPQIFTNEPYTSKVDMYSLGVIMYRLMFGRYPIADNDRQVHRNLVLSQRGNPIICPRNTGRNENMINLVQQMLRYEEKDRPYWNQLFLTDGLTKPPKIIIYSE